LILAKNRALENAMDLAMLVNMNDEPPVRTLSAYSCISKRAGQSESSLKPAVGNLELMVAPAVSYEGVPPDPTHYQFVVYKVHLEVVRFDPGQVEFYLQALGCAVDIG
jgi:hypothetical protein